MSKDLLMKKIMALDFMATDLALFLDTHPRDKEALLTFQKISEEGAKAKNEYEKQFGAICMKNGVKNGKWEWIDDPWPWQKEANFNLSEREGTEHVDL